MDSVVSRFRHLAVALLLAFSSFAAMAQALPHGIFREGEAQHFQLYFKWGLIMAKAGKAEFRMQSDTLAQAFQRGRLLFDRRPGFPI